MGLGVPSLPLSAPALALGVRTVPPLSVNVLRIVFVRGRLQRLRSIKPNATFRRRYHFRLSRDAMCISSIVLQLQLILINARSLEAGEGHVPMRSINDFKIVTTPLLADQINTCGSRFGGM